MHPITRIGITTPSHSVNANTIVGPNISANWRFAVRSSVVVITPAATVIADMGIAIVAAKFLALKTSKDVRTPAGVLLSQDVSIKKHDSFDRRSY